MNLFLQRGPQDPSSTPGYLRVNGIWTCYTLEPALNSPAPPISEVTSCPIRLRPSPHFEALANDGNPDHAWLKAYCDVMPHIEHKPDSVTMIHPGDFPRQTHGCVLVGQTHKPDFVGNSRVAFALLHAKILGAIAAGDAVSIEIRGEVQPADLSLQGDV